MSKDCPKSIQLNNLPESFDLCKVIDEPTFIRNNTTVFLIINLKTEFVVGIAKNDHCAFASEFNIFKTKDEIKFIACRNFSSFYRHALAVHLNEITPTNYMNLIMLMMHLTTSIHTYLKYFLMHTSKDNSLNQITSSLDNKLSY